MSATLACRPSGGPRNHPVEDPIKDLAAAKRFQDAGLLLGPNDSVTCLTCHRIHGEPDDAGFMPSLVNDEHCMVCHPDVRGMVGGAHDMRRNGRECRTGSSCFECHTLQGAVGPSLGNSGGNMLDPTGCLSCHEELRPIQGSDHDMRTAEMPGDLLDTMAFGGFCASCHQVHGERARQGWDGIEAAGVEEDNQATWGCVGCHQAQNDYGATEITEWAHPRDLLLTTANLPWSNTGELPLYDDRGNATDDSEIGHIVCLTCHNPHIWSPKNSVGATKGDGDVRSSFLRGEWEGFCSGCHGDEAIRFYQNYHTPKLRAEVERRREQRHWTLYDE